MTTINQENAIARLRRAHSMTSLDHALRDAILAQADAGLMSRTALNDAMRALDDGAYLRAAALMTVDRDDDRAAFEMIRRVALAALGARP